MAIGLLAMAFVALVLPYKASAATSEGLPEAKRTRAAFTSTPKKSRRSSNNPGGPARVLFLDLRTRAEAMYVGMTTGVDALVPYVEHQELMTGWDPQRNIYRLEPMQDFVPAANRRLRANGLAKTDIVVLICRSGGRSSCGANRLAEDGFSRVYSVVDGFEGDMSPDGRRTVNGWKNTGLPWSFRLDKARMYFPR